MIKIGLLKETKIPIDRRVPLSPQQCLVVLQKFPNVSLAIESSNIRCFTDDEYRNVGLTVSPSIHDCDIFLGVKEVNIDNLIPGKHYFFFSHTAKKQPHNRKLLRALLDKKITLTDYEYLVDDKGVRVVAFGRYAGLTGAYNALLAHGKRYQTFSLKPAHDCRDLEELKRELKKVALEPNTKIVLTGKGRVAGGAREILLETKIPEVAPTDFLTRAFSTPVFCQIDADEYTRHRDGQPFNFPHFFEHPQEYANAFLPFTKAADILIAGHFWHPQSPIFFTADDMTHSDFKIKIVADISCDIPGPIPCTLRASTIDEPLYGYDPKTKQEGDPYATENITVMAVDNLPCELPRDASLSFGEQLISHVLPHLFTKTSENMIKRATITKDGKLTNHFSYLTDFANE